MKHIILALVTVTAVFASTVGSTERRILLLVQQGPSPWSDVRVFDKLQTALSRDQAVNVESLVPQGGEQTVIPDITSTENLISQARERGGQYLICIAAESERLERRKSFHVPLVFHKWEVVGVIEGELRVLDILRNKLVLAEPIMVELHGPRAIQATMDDTKNDPDLHISAPDKLQFMSKLEDKLVADVMLKVKPLIAKGDRELAYRSDLKKKP